MSFCLVLLAAGESKRFSSNTPKPYIKIGEKTLLEYSLVKISKIKEIKKVLIVINKKHKKFIKKIKNKDIIKIIGGKTRQVSTFRALEYIKRNKIKCTNVIIHDAARPNFSISLLKNLKKNLDKNKAVYEITRLISKRIEEWILDKPEQWLWAHRRWGK